MVQRTRLLAATFDHFVNHEWFFDARAAAGLEAGLGPEERARFGAGPEGIDNAGVRKGRWRERARERGRGRKRGSQRAGRNRLEVTSME